MPAPQVNPGLGTILQQSVASTFTTVAQRVSITGPGSEMGTAETTTLDSTAKTYRPTILDNGEISGSLFYDPQDTTHLALYALLQAVPPAAAAFKLKFTDAGATVFSFTAILTKFETNGIEVEGNLGADYTLKVSGVVVVTHT
jgi:hypothetical protein